MEAMVALLERTSLFSGVDPGILRDLAHLAERREYGAGEWLFHESAPRQWFGAVKRGEVELVRGIHGQQRRLALLGEGGILSEGLLLDDLPHSTSALTRQGAVVVQLARATVENFPISGIRLSGLQHFIEALAFIKKACALAKEALETGASVYELVLQKGWMTREVLDEPLRPEHMTHPRQIPRSA